MRRAEIHCRTASISAQPAPQLLVYGGVVEQVQVVHAMADPSL
jgi:hypothetical protein